VNRARLDAARSVLTQAVADVYCVLFHDHPEEEISSVPLIDLRRQWMYDFHIADPEGYAARLGLPPYSEEGAQHARDESDKRLARIQPIIPLLVEQGQWMAAVMTEAGIQSHDIGEHQRHMAMDNYTHLFVHNLMSGAATLAELGILNVDS
jgi:hypothetical protein